MFIDFQNKYKMKKQYVSKYKSIKSSQSYQTYIVFNSMSTKKSGQKKEKYSVEFTVSGLLVLVK